MTTLSARLAQDDYSMLTVTAAMDVGFDAIAPEGLPPIANNARLPGPIGIVIKYFESSMSEPQMREVIKSTRTPSTSKDFGFIRNALLVTTRLSAEARRLASRTPNLYILTLINITAVSEDVRAVSDAVKGIGLRRPTLEPPTRRVEDSGHLKSISRIAQRGELVLFVGAGVSQTAGGPSWDELVDRLTRAWAATASPQLLKPGVSLNRREAYLRRMAQISHSSPLIAARQLRDGLGRSFHRQVRDAVYASAPPSQGSPLMEEIVRLASHESIAGVVTYNFDELLEERMRKSGVHPTTIFTEETKAVPNNLPIYHVHGLLPRNGRITQTHRRSIVFSEDEYHRQFQDAFGWQNVKMVDLLTSRQCLFLGTSLTDPNQRRLLEIANLKQPTMVHYAMLKDKVGLSSGSKRAQLLRAQLRDLMADSLRNIGIQVIWVKEHSDVVALLKQI